MEKNGQMPHAASIVERATMGSRGERRGREVLRREGGGVDGREVSERERRPSRRFCPPTGKPTGQARMSI